MNQNLVSFQFKFAIQWTSGQEYLQLARIIKIAKHFGERNIDNFENISKNEMKEISIDRIEISNDIIKL